MVHLGPLAQMQTWTTPHKVTVLHQIQESTEDGVWKSARHTGLISVVCNCGHGTGWVEAEDVDMDQVLRDHAEPVRLGAPLTP